MPWPGLPFPGVGVSGCFNCLALISLPVRYHPCPGYRGSYPGGHCPESSFLAKCLYQTVSFFLPPPPILYVDKLLTRSKRRLGHISLAQGTNHQENTHVGGGIVNRNGSARNGNFLLRAGGNIEIVIPSPIVADIPNRLRQQGQQLRIEVSRKLSVFSTYPPNLKLWASTGIPTLLDVLDL